MAKCGPVNTDTVRIGACGPPDPNYPVTPSPVSSSITAFSQNAANQTGNGTLAKCGPVNTDNVRTGACGPRDYDYPVVPSPVSSSRTAFSQKAANQTGNASLAACGPNNNDNVAHGACTNYLRNSTDVIVPFTWSPIDSAHGTNIVQLASQSNATNLVACGPNNNDNVAHGACTNYLRNSTDVIVPFSWSPIDSAHGTEIAQLRNGTISANQTLAGCGPVNTDNVRTGACGPPNHNYTVTPSPVSSSRTAFAQIKNNDNVADAPSAENGEENEVVHIFCQW